MKIPVFALLFLLASGGPASRLAAETEPGALWETRRFLDDQNGLVSVACNGAGQVIAVGSFGTMRRSIDHGATWTTIDSGTGMDLQSVTYTGAEWVAVGGYQNEVCIVLRSTDGLHWNSTCLGDSPQLRCVTSGTPGIVALGREEAVVRSTDGGMAWTTSTDQSKIFYDVVWTGSFYCGVGTEGLIKKSTDGQTWTTHSHGTRALYGVAWNGTRLIAVGWENTPSQALVLYSTDGETWTQATVPAASPPDTWLNNASWTGSRFLATGADKAFTSPDGVNWSAHDLPPLTVTSEFCWTGLRLVGVGGSGVIITSDTTAPDETSDWTVRQAGVKADSLQDMTMADVSGTERIVVVGLDGTILTSDDNGYGYTDRSLSGTSTLFAITTATFAPRKFLVVGSGGDIYTSPDGITWTSRVSGTTESLEGVTWHFPVDYPTSPILALAVGRNGTIRGSNDGINWSGRTSGTTEHLEDVASALVIVGKPPAATRRIAAVGWNGTILSSSGGSSWTTRSSGTTEILYAVTVHDNKFVAVGANGTVVTSVDGYSWTLRSTGSPENLFDVKSTGTQLVATGSGGSVFTSSNDGISWKRRYTPYNHSLNAVHPLQSDRIGACSINSVVITSDPVSDYEDWIAVQSPPSGQNDPEDDPNNDGIVNAAAYGHGMDAVLTVIPGTRGRLPKALPTDALGRFRFQLITAPFEIPDLTYIVHRSPTMLPGSWTEVLRRAPGQPCPTGSVHVHSDSMTNTATLTFPGLMGESRQNIRVQYEVE